MAFIIRKDFFSFFKLTEFHSPPFFAKHSGKYLFQRFFLSVDRDWAVLVCSGRGRFLAYAYYSVVLLWRLGEPWRGRGPYDPGSFCSVSLLKIDVSGIGTVRQGTGRVISIGLNSSEMSLSLESVILYMFVLVNIWIFVSFVWCIFTHFDL